MPKQKTYGTPVGVAGGPSEKPSGARPKPRGASDSQVRDAMRKEIAAKGRQSTAKPSKPAKDDNIAAGLDDLLHPTRRTRKSLDDIGE